MPGDLSFMFCNRRIFMSGWVTLCFSVYTHSMGTLCFLGDFAALKTAYALPLNLGRKKSGALRFRVDRRISSGAVISGIG